MLACHRQRAPATAQDTIAVPACVFHADEELLLHETVYGMDACTYGLAQGARIPGELHLHG